MRAPMMSIHTVAAGGGSILHFDGQRFRVGPDSAGANPGPACYRRGGPLTVTDCNVMLGKIQPAFFPHVFGPRGDEPLDAAWCARSSPRSPGRSGAPPATPQTPEAGRRRVPAHRRGEHGQRDQVDLGAARPRRDRVHARLLRRRGRPARLPGGRRARHDARLHPSARRRALGLRHGARAGRARCARRRWSAASRRRSTTWSRSSVRPGRAMRGRARVAGRDARAPREARAPEVRGHRHLARRGAGRARGDARGVRAAYRPALRLPHARRALVVEAVSVEAVGSWIAEGGGDAAPGEPAAPAQARPAPPAQPWNACRCPRAASGAIPRCTCASACCPARASPGPAIIAEQNATTVVEPGWRSARHRGGAPRARARGPRAKRATRSAPGPTR